jgi:superfamily II DNA or RNA helicase
MESSLNLAKQEQSKTNRCIEAILNGLESGYGNLLPESVSSFRPSQVAWLDKVKSLLPTLSPGEEIVTQKDTGTGKTLLLSIVAMLASKHGQVAIVVPTIALGNQTIDALKDYFPGLNINFIYTSEDNKTNATKGLSKGSSIVVIVQDSLAKLKDIEYIDHTHFDPQLIIIDESHLSQSTAVRSGIEPYKEQSVIWDFTATHYRTRIDKKNNDDIPVSAGDSVHWLPRKNVPYGRLIFEDNPDSLLADKEILPIRWHAILSDELRFDKVEESQETGDFNEASLNQTLETSWNTLVQQVNNDIINNPVYENRHNFFFACPNSTDMADNAAAELSKASGHETAVVTAKKCGIYKNGKFTPKTQEAILKRKWKDGKKYVFQIRQLREGYNDDSIDCVLMLNFTKIVADYLQNIGRGRRVHPGQDDLLVVDIIPNRGSVANPVSAPMVLGLMSAREDELLLTDRQKNLSEPGEVDFTIRQEFVMSQMYDCFEYPFQTTERLKKTSLRSYSNTINSSDVIDAIIDILEQKVNNGAQLNKLVYKPSGYPADLAGLRQMDQSELRMVKFNPSITHFDLPNYLIAKYQSEIINITTPESRVEMVLSIHADVLSGLPIALIKQKIGELLVQRPQLYDRLIDPKSNIIKSVVSDILQKSRPKNTRKDSSSVVTPNMASVDTPKNAQSRSKADKKREYQDSIPGIFSEYLEHEIILQQAIDKICEGIDDKQISRDTLIVNFALFLNRSKLAGKAKFEDWLQLTLIKNDGSLNRIANEYILKATEISPAILGIALKIENIVKQKYNNEASIKIFETLKTKLIYTMLLEQCRSVKSFNIGLVLSEEVIKGHIIKYLSKQTTKGISQFFDESDTTNILQIADRFLHYLMTTAVPTHLKSLSKYHISQGTIYQISSPQLVDEIIKNSYYSSQAYLDPLILVTMPDVFNIISASGLDTETAINKLKSWIIYYPNRNPAKGGYSEFLNEISIFLVNKANIIDEDYMPINIADNRILNLDLEARVLRSFPYSDPVLVEEYYQLFIKIYKNTKDTDKNKKSTFEKNLEKTRFVASLHDFLSQNVSEKATVKDAKILQPHLRGVDFQSWTQMSDDQKNAAVLEMVTGGYFKTSAISPIVISTLILSRKEQVTSQNQAIIRSTPFIEPTSLNVSQSHTGSHDININQGLVDKEFSKLISNKQRNLEMVQKELSDSNGFKNISTDLIKGLLEIIVNLKGPRGKNYQENSNYFGVVYSNLSYQELLLKVRLFVNRENPNLVTETCIKELYRGKQVPDSCIVFVGTKKYIDFSKVKDQQLDTPSLQGSNVPNLESLPSYTSKQAIAQVAKLLKMKEISAHPIILRKLGNKKQYTKAEIDQLIKDSN